MSYLHGSRQVGAPAAQPASNAGSISAFWSDASSQGSAFASGSKVSEAAAMPQRRALRPGDAGAACSRRRAAGTCRCASVAADACCRCLQGLLSGGQSGSGLDAFLQAALSGQVRGRARSSAGGWRWHACPPCSVLPAGGGAVRCMPLSLCLVLTPGRTPPAAAGPGHQPGLAGARRFPTQLPRTGEQRAGTPAAPPACPRTRLSPSEAAAPACSRPSATRKIFLDFDGHSTTGSAWSSGTVTTPAYDTDGNPSSFSAAEKANMVAIWRAVAEDFAAFDVDITTEDPGGWAPVAVLRSATALQLAVCHQLLAPMGLLKDMLPDL